MHCSNTKSESESDCEIIEQVTPVIVLDDDFVDDKSEHSGSNTDPTSQTINSSQTTEQSTQIFETTPLFFVDKNPGTNFETPIYELNSVTKPNMAQNFQITFHNQENDANLDNSFAPNPILSSTRLNVSCDDPETSASNTSSDKAESKATNLCISINSTNDASRCVSLSKSPPIVAPAKLTNGSTNCFPQSMKRKAQNETEDEPSLKRKQCESSDVIVLNDTISDDESVVFVSETLEHQSRNRFNMFRDRAADFISLTSDNANPNKNTVSLTVRHFTASHSVAQREVFS